MEKLLNAYRLIFCIGTCWFVTKYKHKKETILSFEKQASLKVKYKTLYETHIHFATNAKTYFKGQKSEFKFCQAGV